MLNARINLFAARKKRKKRLVRSSQEFEKGVCKGKKKELPTTGYHYNVSTDVTRNY
jgi:hypothetical protein